MSSTAITLADLIEGALVESALIATQRACRRGSPEEAATVRRHVGQVERTARTWTDAHREEARRLQAEALSWSAIAERVCGDRRFKSTVQGWLRSGAVA